MKKILWIFILIFFFFGNESLFSAEVPSKILQDAKIFYENGLYVKSLELVNSALKINPYYKDCYNLLGLIYQKTDNYDSAEFFLKKSISLDSSYDKSMFDLANIYISRANYDSAAAILINALKINYKNPEYRSALMECYINTSNFKKFLEEFELIEKLHPDYSVSKYLYGNYLKKTGKTIDAKKYYLESLKREYTPLIPYPYLDLADILLSENNILEAKDFYEEASKYPETSKKSFIQLAKIYNYTGQFDKTIRLWDITPSYYLNAYHIGLAYYNQAMTLLSDERIESAGNLLERSLFYFKSALLLNADDELTRDMIEKILLRTSPINSSERNEYSEYRKLNGLYFLYDNGKIYESILELYKSINLNPQDIQNRLELAKFYQKKNYIQSAISEYEKILDINSSDLFSKDNLELLKYNYESLNQNLNEFIKTNQNFKKNLLKIAVKISVPVYSINHSNLSEYIEDMLQNLSGINSKFEFFYIPKHLETIETIEQYSRTIDADGIIILDLIETDNYIKTGIKIYNITALKSNPRYSINRPRRSSDLTVIEDKTFFEGKNKLLKTACAIFDKINNNFNAIGTIQKLYQYKAIVNLGYMQGINKLDKLKLISRHSDREFSIGEIIVNDLNENYCICDIRDISVLNAIKTGDVSFITK
ncbi:tetratricopeptide repeat protein [Candidatus Dependentiae bacterium]|nr:tetratricopeptide repeat protein [Candidatus Dependentiae bacterium]